ncbi:hypothetical protein GQ55_4G252100 [Panicum hallii var. hallii]|uniref:Uncharacterized protein n=1 Tax=Panicum hallii var. hallii TaxID=1504633 RepID=A0A2T7E009_9POAL|nr:hypothetical protein GQ55_4G252100 [Panicum hallii var. hallii]PUZ61170.1 hypothetical protein GQ55_4G252100 [Panicum hallii var. hallii]
MCLPFCCGHDDHGSPSQGAGTGMKTTPDHPGHGNGRTEQAIPSPTRNGKGSQEGNGASQNKNGGDFNGGNTDSPPPTPPPTLAPQFPEDLAEHRGTQKTIPSPPPAVQASKHGDQKMVVESPEHKDQIFTKSTLATKGPKQSEHGPRHQGPVAAPQPKDVPTGTLRTPPSPQVARRAREDDYSPTVPAPAASNSLGDRGHDDHHAYGGKDDRRPPGKSWRR